MTNLLARYRSLIVIFVVLLTAAGIYVKFIKPNLYVNPAATRIVFTATSTKSATLADIYVVKSDGSELIKVTGVPTTRGIDPTWDSGKTRIFYSADIVHYQIAVMGAGGETPTLLTLGPSPKSSPAVSPDGKKVAFVNEVSLKNKEIDVFDFSDGTTHKLIKDGINLYPVWATNTKLLYVKKNDQGDNSIYANESSKDINLTGAKKVGHSFAVSPDGKKVAFIGHDDNQIYTMGIDGSGIKVLTSQKDGDLTDPSYSPDGSELVAVLTPSGNKDSVLVTVSLSDGKLTRVQLLQPLFNISSPNWFAR